MPGSISIEGLDRVLAKFDEAGADVQAAVMDELKAGAMDIIAEAQLNLTRQHNNTTGLLRQSGKVQKAGPLDLDVGFFDRSNKSRGYAEYLEKGRRPGKMPPPDEIEAWVRKKHSRRTQSLSAVRAAAIFSGKSEESLIRSAAWAISKSIAKRGTRPHPFFYPAITANRTKLIRRIQTRIQRALNER